MPSPPRFTPAERALLAPYVTNLDEPVFVLTRLPEVIKGALFSRYSRSALGLRELLLKEFIQQGEAALAEIGALAPAGTPEAGAAGGSLQAEAAAEAAAQRAHLAVERAQTFYDRILDGYGDDSIGELGGAHLAIEDVSILATKVLEDARIGGSPLEKSTRYVSFAGQRDGEFLFYREPTLMASPHRERYLATCQALFETYRDLIPPLTAFLERELPRPAEVSEGAWRRSVRARVYDALRGLLPAATLTNMGIFGNGRFFETLLVKLRLAPLAELQGLGEAMYRELAKVIPSFIRRARPDNAHFAGFRDYEAALAQAVGAAGGALRRPAPGAPALPPGAAEAGPPEVALADHDPYAPAKVLAALAFPAADSPWAALRQAADALSPAEQARLFAALAAARTNRRHKPPRALELAAYTFDLLGDFGMYRDLHRHRMLTQQRQPLSTRHGYEVPEEVRAADLQGPYEAALARAAETWEAVARDFPLQAQYVVPMAYRIRWQMHINLRALIWLVELRSSPQGHPAYRRMAQGLYRCVAEAHPALAPLFRFVDLETYPLGRLGAEQRQEDKRGNGGKRAGA